MTLFTDQHGDVVGRYRGYTVASTQNYDPFGAVTSSSGEKSDLGFQSGWTDPSTGQVNMAARWYSPGSGQFTSRDSWNLPANPSWATNRYAYGNADPVGGVDLNGHDVIADIDADFWKIVNPIRQWGQSTLAAATADIPPTVETGIAVAGAGATIPFWGAALIVGALVGTGMVVFTGSTAHEQPCNAACNPKPVQPAGVGDPTSPNPCQLISCDAHNPKNDGNGNYTPPPPPQWLIDAVHQIIRPSAGTTAAPRTPTTNAATSSTTVTNPIFGLLDAVTKVTEGGPDTDGAFDPLGLSALLPEQMQSWEGDCFRGGYLRQDGDGGFSTTSMIFTCGNGPWDLHGKNPLSIVPPDATMRYLKPDPNGGAQDGVEYKWKDAKDQTVRMRIHGPDGTAPAGSNSASGYTYRVQIGKRYQDIAGNLYHANSHNPNSPYYEPDAANETHIPWPSWITLPWL
jgi:RHS repeat-associated protein